MDEEDDDGEDVAVEQVAPPPKGSTIKPGKGGKASKAAKQAKMTPQEKLDADPDYQAYVKLSGGTIRKVDGTFAGKDEKLFGAESPITERVAAGEQPDPMASPKPKPSASKAAPKTPQTPAASAEEREKFLGLAKRFKVPTAVADAAMAGDRDALLAWTTELDTMQARFDEMSARGAAPQGAPKGAAQESKAGTPKAASAGAPARSEPGSDIREQLVQMAAEEGLSEAFADKLLALVKPDADLKALAESVRSMHEKQARTALSKEFKGLADAKAYASVKARVARWIANGVFQPDQVEEAMRDSCKIEFHGQKAVEEDDEEDEEEDDAPDARDEGSPTVPKRGSNTRVTSGDKDFDAYVALTRGANPKDVRSRLTR